MKQIAEFLKTTALGGFLVLLPVLITYLLAAKALTAAIALASPIANLFPKGTFDQVKAQVLIALILIFGASFLIGLALRSARGKRLGLWIERNVLGRVPAYHALKGITRGLVGGKDAQAFKPAFLVSSDEVREIAYVVEDFGEGPLTVLVPWSPTAFAGSVKVVARERIEMVDTKLINVTGVLNLWGVGAQEMLGKGNRGGKQPM